MRRRIILNELKEMLEELKRKPKPDFKKLLEQYLSIPKEERRRMAREALETYISMHENKNIGE